MEVKSVPDFESCGAVWVTSAQLTALDDTDYRSPDPAFWFPAVTKGALFSHSDVSFSLPVSVRHMYMPEILLFVIDILVFLMTVRVSFVYVNVVSSFKVYILVGES